MTRPQRTIEAAISGFRHGGLREAAGGAFAVGVGESVGDVVDMANGLLSLADRVDRMTNPVRMLAEIQRRGLQGFANQYGRNLGASAADALLFFASRGVGAGGDAAVATRTVAVPRVVPVGVGGGPGAALRASAGFAQPTVQGTLSGLMRAIRFGAYWRSASLDETVSRIAGSSPDISTVLGKIIYANPLTNLRVVYDVAGDYFRIQNPAASGVLEYLDLSGGVIPANVPVLRAAGGYAYSGIPAEVREALTHFLNSD